MLIRVREHTPEDLEAWGRDSMDDRWWATQASFLARVRQALDAMAAFLSAGPCFVGVSWGKDSVVVAHLAWTLRDEHGLDVQLVHARAAEHDDAQRVIANPHVTAVRNAFLARWPLPYEERLVRASWEGSRWVSPEGGTRDVFDAVLEGRHISGVRAEESGRRKMRVRRWGLSTENTCAPLGWWTGRDVFAYLEAHDLPVHPAYAMTFGGRLDRARLRVSALGGDTGRGFGRREWEEHYYREYLR